MRTLIKVIGVGWAVMGAWNIVLLPWAQSPDNLGLLTFGMIFNMVLFVMPGLVLYAVAGRK